MIQSIEENIFLGSFHFFPLCTKEIRVYFSSPNINNENIMTWWINFDNYCLRSLWRFVEDLKKFPEKYATEKRQSPEEKSEELMSDTGSWGTDFEDDVDDEEADDGDSAGNSLSNANGSSNNQNGTKSASSIGQSCSRNSEFRNSLMIFRENEKTSLSSREKKNSMGKGKRLSYRVKHEEVAESTYTNCETDIEDGPEQDESTYANCVNPEDALVSTKSKNVSNLHGKVEKTLAEQLKEQLKLINSRKTTSEITKAPSIFEKSSLDKKPQKSFLHDVAPSLNQQILNDNILAVSSTNVEELDKNFNAEKLETDLPRPPLTIRNLDLVANLPTRTEESEDEYEPFDEQIIEQNKRLSLARVDSKQSLNSARQNSLESVYKTPSITSQDKQDEEYEIYESITEAVTIFFFLFSTRVKTNSV